jgi:hypothetical protein
LIDIIDREIAQLYSPFTSDKDGDATLSEIDKWAYEYFCLSDDEIILIEDMIERILPAVQPHQGSFPDLWKPPTERERQEYAATLVRSVDDWLQGSNHLRARLEAKNADIGVLRLALSGTDQRQAYDEEDGVAVGDALSRIMNHIHQPIAGNFQLIPDLRVFIGENLYLVKPMQRRFWLRSTDAHRRQA